MENSDTNASAGLDFASFVTQENLANALNSSHPGAATRLQAKCIPVAMQGRNVVISGVAGSGKLLAFGAPALGRVDSDAAAQSLIVCKDEDRAAQISSGLESLAKELGVTVEVATGSAPSASVLIGSVSALTQLIEANDLQLEAVNLVVVDGIDEMVALQLIEDLEAILEKLDTVQFAFVGSVNPMPPQVAGLTRRLLKEPEFITVDEDDEQTAEVTHLYAEVEADVHAKPRALTDLLHAEGASRGLVFCNSGSDTDMVEAILRKAGFETSKVRGGAPERERRGSRPTRKPAINTDSIVVASDEAIGELQDMHFDLVINYAVPSDPEIYLHRTSRIGGAHDAGKSISLVGPLDITNFHFLKKVVDFEIGKASLPGPEARVEAQLNRLAKDAATGEHIDNDMVSAMCEMLAAHEDRDKIIALLVHNTINVLPNMSKSSGRDHAGRGERRGRNARDRDRDDRDRKRSGRRDSDRRDGRRGDRRDRDDSRADRIPTKKDVRYYIGSGLSDGLTEDNFKSMLSEHTGITGEQLKRFSSRELYSFADFDEELGEDLLGQLSQLKNNKGGEIYVAKATVIPVPRSDSESKTEDDSSTRTDVEDAAQGSDTRADEVELANEAAEA